MVYQDEAVRLKATFKDFSATLVDPSAIALNLFDPNGAVVLTKAITDMTKVSTGVYYYEYDLASTATVGLWVAKWLATIATLHKPGKVTFIVEGF